MSQETEPVLQLIYQKAMKIRKLIVIIGMAIGNNLIQESFFPFVLLFLSLLNFSDKNQAFCHEQGIKPDARNLLANFPSWLSFLFPFTFASSPDPLTHTYSYTFGSFLWWVSPNPPV